MTMARILTLEEMEAGLDEIRRSPADIGVVKLIVRRPKVNERESLDVGELSLSEGLLGDCWSRPVLRKRSAAATPDFECQITLMNSRAIALVAQESSRWALAGDQFYVDFDLSQANAPPGTKLQLGDAIVQVTALPHSGCRKFAARFGADAVKFVNSNVGKQLRLRGINTTVIQAGIIRVGDAVSKI